MVKTESWTFSWWIEKKSFSSFFFLCDIEGHIDDQKIKNSLEELGLHCEDMHVLGVFKSDKFRQK